MRTKVPYTFYHALRKVNLSLQLMKFQKVLAVMYSFLFRLKTFLLFPPLNDRIFYQSLV